MRPNHRAAARAGACVGAALVLAGLPAGTAAGGGSELARASALARAPAVCAPETARVARGADVHEPVVSRAELAAVDRELASRRAATRTDAAGAAGTVTTVTVPVHVHVLLTDAGAGNVPDARIAKQLSVLAAGFAGQQSRIRSDTGFRFRLASVDRTRNSRWRTMSPESDYERNAKRRLHRGGPGGLDLYLTDQSRSGFLGWSTFAWDRAEAPAQDGVVVAIDSLPGGRGPYGLGDTAVHEVGHWLGLLHTFGDGQGAGCINGDEVADTPAEAFESYGCPTGADTCPAPGLDPVHNFMDYSDDQCMTRFTPGQRDRMRQMWDAYRG